MKAQLSPEGGQIKDAPPVIYTKSSRSIIFDIRMWKKHYLQPQRTFLIIIN